MSNSNTIIKQSLHFERCFQQTYDLIKHKDEKKDTKIISVKYKEKWIEQCPIISSSASMKIYQSNLLECII